MREYEVKTVQLPHEYDINVYKIKVAFDKIKICPYCGTNENLLLSYHRTDEDILDETVFQSIKRVLFNKIKHTLTCKCYTCGASVKINFYTDKHCIDLYDTFSKRVDEENAKNNNVIDPNKFNLNTSRWIKCNNKKVASFYE